MRNLKKAVKATISSLIVALLFAVCLFFLLYAIFSKEINWAISAIDIISVDKGNHEQEQISIDEETKKIINYPEYGTKYANIKIEKIDVDLPVYLGDDLDTLKKGVGHSSGSYFPGEGGSIIYMGHNSKDTFRRFSELEIGDKIVVTTSYGEFEYVIYNYKIIHETDLEELPIQKEEEILMVYTCYPLNNIGYAYQRYVVYANLVD